MPAIAVVDDKTDQRVTLLRQIDVCMPKQRGWEVLGTAPFEDIKSYTSWISENDISVLILDERLAEGAEYNILPVGYSGHDVVDYVRQRYTTLPMGIITSHSDDAPLQQRCSDVEFILDRLDFASDPESYVSRFVRMGTKFYEENRQELERLAELSRKIARGIATSDEVKEAGGLQLSQAMPLESFQLRSEWLTKMEQAVADLTDLEKRIRRHLEDNTDDEVV